MLQDAAAATRAKKEETSELEGVTIIAPAITRKTPPPTHTHTVRCTNIPFSSYSF